MGHHGLAKLTHNISHHSYSVNLKRNREELKLKCIAVARWLNWLEHRPLHQKNCGFDYQSGHILRL